MNLRISGVLGLLAMLAACAEGPPPATSPAAPASVPSTAVAPPGEPVQATASMFDLQVRSLREYVKAFNRHDAKAIASLYGAGAVFIERGSPASASADAIRSNYQDYFDTYPDVSTAITRSWHWGDAALFEYVEGGTQTGDRIVLPPPPQRFDPLSGAIDDQAPSRKVLKPTGKKFGYVGASLLRFTPDGHIRLDTTYADELTREVQSGFAPGQLAKLAVRTVVPVPRATDAWETHKGGGDDPAQASAVASRNSLYKKFSLRSDKDFLGGLSGDIVISSFDDPKDAKGKPAAAALLEEWNTMFSDGVVDATEGWTVDGYVVLLGTYTGKHVGAWGPIKPTQKTFKTHFLDILKVGKDEKVERLWSYANNYELLQYLGYDSKAD